MSLDENIESWPEEIRVLALAFEANQARAWAEGVRDRDGRDPVFDQRQLGFHLLSVRRLLASLIPNGADDLVVAAHVFTEALAEHGDVPPDGPWPESEDLKQVIQRQLRTELPPTPLDRSDWARRAGELADRPWIGGHARNCPAGWLPLLERAVAQAERSVNGTQLEGCRTNQIKEKFGALRWYLSSNELLSVIVDFAELTSHWTCLVCGTEGRLRTDRNWLLTLCDAHDQLDRGGDALALSRLAYPFDPD
jgi:hypothetical protein